MIYIKNVGKQFEEDFKKSVPSNVLYYRLPDSAQSFNQTSNLRFSAKNPCDSFLFSGKYNTFYALELKSVKDKSISFERTKEDKGTIHLHQQKGLENFATYDNVVAGFIINFRDVNRTYFIEICDYIDLINNIDKKSFNENDLLKHNPTLIKQELKRVRYSYDVEQFIRDTHL